MIIKRGKTWTYSIDLGWEFDENGEKKRKRTWKGGFPTKGAAEIARAEHVTRLDRGEYIEPSDITVGEWLKTWLAGRPNLADTTRVGYRYEVKRLTRVFGPRKLQQLTPDTIEVFYRDLTEQGYSPKTVKNCHGVLNKALKDAVRKSVLVRNPADGLELPRLKRPKMEVWTADELRQFLNHTESHRLHAAFVLMIHSGMRRSELLGLRWRSVDWDNNRISIVDTVVPVDNRPVLRIDETKTKGSRRVIALDDWPMSVLRRHRVHQVEEQVAAGVAYNDQDLVFADEIGGIVSPDWFTRTTKQMAAEAGVTPLTPQSARHTWATIALSQGVPAKVVQERLGHSSINITLDRYSHLVNGMDRTAAEVFAAAIR